MEASPTQRSTATIAELFNVWFLEADEQAREELIERHLPLARQLANRYARHPQQVEDLVQVASVGLIAAVERFDPSRGFAFSSFAVPTILGELKRHFRDNGWSVRVDRRTQERVGAIVAAQDELSERGETATVEALADHLACDPRDVLDGLAASLARTSLSLDAPPAGASLAAGDSDVSALVDRIGADDPGLARANDRATLTVAFRHLPRIERRVVYLRFGEDLSQQEIAARVGMSQMHVSRLLRRALGRLRELIEDPRKPAWQARA